jgi:DNA-binding FrmR family transcriptional regulator
MLAVSTKRGFTRVAWREHGAIVDNGDNPGAVAMAPSTIFTTTMLEGQMAPTHGYSSQKDNYAKRLRRIEGQVRGIAKMIEDDKYCIDVLTQISAANSALQSVALNLLDEHLGHCVTHAVAQGGSEADQKLAEASAAIARLVRS